MGLGDNVGSQVVKKNIYIYIYIYIYVYIYICCIRETTYRKCENMSMRESLSPSSGRSAIPICSMSFRTLTLEPRTQVRLVLFMHLLNLFLITLFLTLQGVLAGPVNLQPPAERFWQLDLTMNPHGKSDLCPWRGF